jgi:hypothetical protein
MEDLEIMNSVCFLDLADSLLSILMTVNEKAQAIHIAWAFSF